MATWDYRGKNKAVYVIYFSGDGKPKRLPRDKTKHSDKLTTQQIVEWVAVWSRLNEVQKLHPELGQIPTEWMLDAEGFETWLTEDRKLDERTVKEHIKHIKRTFPESLGFNLLQLLPVPFLGTVAGQIAKAALSHLSRP